MKVVRHVDTQVAGEDHAVIPVQDDEGPEVGRGVRVISSLLVCVSI